MFCIGCEQPMVSGQMGARTRYHGGWAGLNCLTDGIAVLPDSATTLFAFSTGQSSFDTIVDVAAV